MASTGLVPGQPIPDLPIPGDDVSALILGAGEGVRMGQGPKAFLRLQAQTLLERAILSVAPYCAEIIAGVREADLPLAEELVNRLRLATRVLLVPGGRERQETVTRLVENASCPLVLLHEVARPFARADSFAAVLTTASEHGAAALYTELRVRDGLALMRNGAFAASLPRAEVVALQTPHAYLRTTLLDAHRRAQQAGRREDSTVALVQWAGYEVRLLPGCADNIKITYPEDWERVLAMSQVMPSPENAQAA